MTTISRAASTDAKRFQISDVITKSVRVFNRHVIALTALAAGVYWLPVSVYNYGAPPLFHRFLPPVDYAGSFALGRAVANALISLILTVSVALVTLSRERAPTETLLRRFERIVGLFPRIVLISLVLRTDQIVRALLLFLPAGRNLQSNVANTALWSFVLLGFTVFTTVAFGIAGPVLAIERKGVLATLGRTFRLMSGHRWSFLGLVIMATIVAAIVAVTEQAVLGHALRTNPVIQSANLFVFGQMDVVWAVAVAVSYRELTRIKDGWRPAELADVFD